MQISYMETSSDAMARVEAASAAQYLQYQSDLEGIRKQLARLIKDEEQAQLTNIREWLAVESQSLSDHDAYQKIRKEYSTTTSWILDHDTIKDWMVDILWHWSSDHARKEDSRNGFSFGPKVKFPVYSISPGWPHIVLVRVLWIQKVIQEPLLCPISSNSLDARFALP